MNSRLLQALACKNEGRAPVWLMRQAGRYMPQYRAMREKHSLWELFHRADLAAQVTRLPLSLLDVDAAILFSDILVIAESLGLSIHFPETGGPRVEPAVRTAEQVDALPMLCVEESLSYVLETIRLLKPDLNVPLIGFCGGPFTVASYLIDSGSKQEFSLTKQWMKEDPSSLHRLLQKITLATIAYLKAQVKEGVNALQIFDSWLNILDEQQRHAFAYPYLKQIVDALANEATPVILFCRHSSLFPQELAALNPSCISFDWLRPMNELRSSVSKEIAVQGNIEPSILKLSKPEITQATQSLLQSMDGEKGFILNLGHGVTPDIPLDHVRHFVDVAKAWK
ncbi:MAG: uroporphyrinogen decarboxylase [Verrucomicrobia bacterium]|nr:uroporphyrinogen decarboxylase [Verrucomicrobiota bacterium]